MTPTGTVSRRLRAAGVMVICAVVLAACGARIDTNLQIAFDGSGQRVMTLTLDDDQESVVGGAAAVDASIRTHKPDAIDYSGITTGPAGELVVTFIVTFASPEEYYDKVAALINASDQTWDADSTFTVEQTQFVNGVDVVETFTSADILGWFFAGLIADGVVDESDESNMYETGETTVDFGGITYSASQPITFSELDDRGFASVTMATVVGDELISRTITYSLAEKAVYNSNASLYDGLFGQLQGSGFSVAQDLNGPGVQWTVTVEAETAEEIAAATRAALVTEEVTFTVVREGAFEDPATELLTLANYASCSAICSRDAGPIVDVISVPGGFGLSVGDVYPVDTGYEQVMSPDSWTATFSRANQMDAITANVTITRTGAVEWRGEFTVSADARARVGDGFLQLLEPGPGVGTISEAVVGGNTVYSVVIAGANPAEFSEHYADWVGDSSAGITTNELDGDSFFKAHYGLHASLPLPWMVATHAVGVPMDTTVTVAWPQSFNPEGWISPVDAQVDGATMTLTTYDGAWFDGEASGFTIAGLVTLGVLAFLLLAAAVLAVLFRKRIAARLQARREQRAIRVAEAAAAAPAMVPAATATATATASAAATNATVPPAQAMVPAAPDAQADDSAPPSDNEADYL